MKVFIIDGNNQYHDMFTKRGFEVTPQFLDADLVVFTGGEDVTPLIYGEENTRSYCNFTRDLKDAGFYAIARRMGKPMVGICRGGQFLNVMCDGSMIQHVEGHAIHGTHSVRDHSTNKEYQVTSTHHQMMLCDPALADIVATASIVGEFDQEVLYYRDGNCLCFQPHPEFPNYPECTDYFFSLLSDYLGIK